MSILILTTTFISANTIQCRSNSEILEAVQNAYPGAIIQIMDGTYKDITLNLKNSGTAESPITLCAATPGKAMISGISGVNVLGDHIVTDGLVFRDGTTSSEQKDLIIVKGSHCRITNCAIIDFDNTGHDGRWIVLFGQHNRLDHCYFREKESKDTTVQVEAEKEHPNYHAIDHNYFAHRPNIYVNGGETIRIGYSHQMLNISRTTVEYNLFEECDGEIEIISCKSCENIFRYNTFRRSFGTLTLRHGNRCIVAGNFFLGEGKEGSGGVRIKGEGHLMVNNYFSGLTGHAGAIVVIHMGRGLNHPGDAPRLGPDAANWMWDWPASDIAIVNNTFVDNKGPVLDMGTVFNPRPEKLLDVPAKHVCITNNVLCSTDTVPVVGTADDISWTQNIIYSPNLSLAASEGIAVRDPQFVKSADGLYRPSPSSPLVNNAATVMDVCGAISEIEGIPGASNLFATDMDGQPRKGKPDIGADEVTDAAVEMHPLTSKEVGPDWHIQ